MTTISRRLRHAKCDNKSTHSPVSRNVLQHQINTKTSLAVAETGNRLATIDTGRKVGSAVPLLGGAGSPSNTMLSGPRPTSLPSGILIHPAVWPQQVWTENQAVVPLLWELGPHLGLTVWRGPRPTATQSGTLIYQTVCPQYTNVTDRTGQQSDSTGRTVLQTVSQKLKQV